MVVEASSSLNLLLNSDSRKAIRTGALVVYFILFQILILLQKPFLQVDFIVSFYSAFCILFLHHILLHFFEYVSISAKRQFISYGLDFLILISFMKSFPQLSSFLLVIQLFMLFLASFDLKFIQLCSLGLLASVGISIMNLTVFQTGSGQNILSLALFNLSYIAVIIVSGQLKDEIYGIQSDLTRTRKKSKSQAEFSKVLIEKIPLGLVVTGSNHQILLQNDFISESLQLNITDISKLIEFSNLKISSDINYQPTSHDEQRTYQFDKMDYFDEELNENLTVSLIKDVTDLRKLEDQLKQNEKLAAIGQLAAGIAHEIRNPLAGISGSVQLLSTETNDPDQMKLMKIIIKEIDRLNNLITEFLEYAKPEKKPDQSVDTAQVLDEVVQNIKYQSARAGQIQWQLQLSNHKILGFSEKLKQAFLNIVINAVQALEGQENPKIKILTTQSNGFVTVSIQDNGAGMKPETLKRLFEPFHTTKIKGTGLGLAVTHKILEAHSARVEVKSEVGIGTEFIIKFPDLGH